MDATFNPPFLGRIKRPHFCEDAINIGDFCKSFSDEVAELITDGRTNKHDSVMQTSMDMPESAFEEVADICSVDQLACEGEPTPNPKAALGPVKIGPDSKTNFPNIQSDLSGGWGDTITEQAVTILKSLRSQRRKTNARQRSVRKVTAHFRSLRYTNEIRLESDGKHKLKTKYPMKGFSCAEPVVAVRFYQPPQHVTSQGVKKGCLSVFHLNQEVLCLGSNRLTELRDVIRCANDRLVVNDCHLSPASVRPVWAKEVYPSGFFCINREFYVDQRNPKSIDYSEPIRQWASERGLGDLTRRPMEEVRIRDLTVRLGYPYVYVHQGRCQHMVVFSDVRLLHPSNDAVGPRCYPKIVATRREQRQACNVCDRLNAKWLTTNHELTPTDPTYFCDSCFKDFNYSRRSRPISEFKAYPVNLEPRPDELSK